MESLIAAFMEIMENTHYSALVAVLVWADVLHSPSLNACHTRAKMPDFVLLPFQDYLWSIFSKVQILQLYRTCNRSHQAHLKEETHQ